MISNRISFHLYPVPENRIIIVSPEEHTFGCIAPEIAVIKGGDLMTVIPAEPFAAIYTSAGCQPGIIAHIIHFHTIERYFF